MSESHQNDDRRTKKCGKEGRKLRVLNVISKLYLIIILYMFSKCFAV